MAELYQMQLHFFSFPWEDEILFLFLPLDVVLLVDVPSSLLWCYLDFLCSVGGHLCLDLQKIPTQHLAQSIWKFGEKSIGTM
jgi:hypothetical protein